jgi:hypothetical protein
MFYHRPIAKPIKFQRYSNYILTLLISDFPSLLIKFQAILLLESFEVGTRAAIPLVPVLVVAYIDRLTEMSGS